MEGEAMVEPVCLGEDGEERRRGLAEVLAVPWEEGERLNLVVPRVEVGFSCGQ